MEIQTQNILGNTIHCFKSHEILFQTITRDMSRRHRSGYITVNNVHTIMEGFWDADFRRIINEAYLSIPDGKPLEIFGRLKGNKEISRLFGPTVMEHFIDWGRDEGHTHFFLGSSEKNLQLLRTAINQKYPGAKIAGMISPPYKPVEEWDNDALISAINEAKPDFIWIGLGAPKQERWMFQHYRHINSGVLFGIGAGFDYLAGNTRHAPEWMKKFALEWLYRLIQEPRRLWKRYFKTIPQFIFFGGLEIAGMSFRKNVKKTTKV